MRELDTGNAGEKNQQSMSKRIVVGIVLLCFITVSVVYLSIQIYEKQQYKVLLEFAENYYETGDYVNAIQSYKKIIQKQPKQQSDLVIKFADCYIGIQDYESAAMILQDAYALTESEKLRDKIQETVGLLLDTEYEANVQRGDKYIEAGEYSKAIQEYKEAYRLKPESGEALSLLITAYLDNGDIENANELFEDVKGRYDDGLTLKLQNQIAEASVREQYEQLLIEADDFFYNESYDECFDSYDQAITLLPEEMQAYEQMVDAYISLQRYEDAIKDVQKYKIRYQLDGLDELCDYIQNEKQMQESLSSLMKKLYEALMDGKIKRVRKLIHSSEYETWVAEGNTYYYSATTERRIEQIPSSRGLVIYGSGYIYCGSFENAKRSGKGKYFGLSNDELGYFLYSGQWSDDLPNGEGTLNTVMEYPYGSKNQQFIVTVQGQYRNGLENGRMRRDFYLEENYFGSLEYRSLSGIPQPNNMSIDSYNWPNSYTYVIGNFVTVNGNEEFNYTDTTERWQVPGL